MTTMLDEAAADPQQTISELRRQLDERTAERNDALEQQTATAEVLQVINSSPGDLAPVFDAMLERAIRLCEAPCGHFRTLHGELLHLVAARGVPDAYAEFLRIPVHPHPDNPLGRMLRGERVIVNLDVSDEEPYRAGDPLRHAFVHLGGARSAAHVALVKDDKLLGTLTIYRQEVRPFSDKQLTLLQNFADQAVIAMENARLLRELQQRTGDLQESLEYQTATSDVLKVISRSTFDLQPVLDTLLETAAQLCDAEMGLLANRDSNVYRVASCFAFSPEWDAAVRRLTFEPGRGSVVGRTALERQVVHVADIAADPEHALPEVITVGKMRTALGVPLLREQEPIGIIYLARTRVAPFTERQIELVRTFADQAVIAIENTRLLTEQREALERQTATAEILRVISSSPTDVQPVFEAVVENAMRLSESAFAGLWWFDGQLLHLTAHRNLTTEGIEAFRSMWPMPPSPESLVGRAFLQRSVLNLEDASVDSGYVYSTVQRAVGYRSTLLVPLLRSGASVGVVAVWRRNVARYSDKHVDLLQTFADQAVIAVENVRLFSELTERTGDLQESLEYQTAISDVLKVISRSTSDLQPVLDTLIETAVRLCGAHSGTILIRDGGVYRYVSRSTSGANPEHWAALRRRTIVPGRDSVAGRVALEGRVVHVADILADPDHAVPESVAAGRRTILGVPLLHASEPIGVITLNRHRVEPFTERQIELVRTFADQAVIAIENARLITETREALEQQTATSEVLQVINSSPGELAPVFDTMLEKAMRLCGAAFGELRSYDGERFQRPATRGVPSAYVEYFASHDTGIYGPETGPARILAGERMVHVPDLVVTEPYQRGDPDRRALVDLGGARAMVLVPLLKDDAVRGYIMIFRQQPGPFSDKQIALLQSFAAQAVIAMENARLLSEIRQRQAELRVTFDNMADGVVMFDEDLRLTAWNRNFQELLDLPDALLAERPSYADYLRILAERGEFGTDDIEAELSRRLENADQELRLERTRPDGRVIEVRRNSVPDGGFVLIYSDITERKRSEAEIRAARANLIQAEKMASLGQLTAGIAHEIKNPLNFVNNFADLSGELLKELQESAAPGWAALDDDKRAEIDETMVMLTGNLEKIGEHGRRADGIVRSMLEHSRGGTGERRSVDLNGLIEEALNLAYHGARAQDQSFNITMERDFDQGIAPIELVPQDVTRVLLNLFGNGFYAANKRGKQGADPKFTPTLKVSTRDPGDAVEIRVRDNGTGIPAEIRDKLFQPFFTTKPTGEGTGLGLSISYDIVTQQHGGTITVESEPGAFTEFSVRLPRQ